MTGACCLQSRRLEPCPFVVAKENVKKRLPNEMTQRYCMKTHAEVPTSVRRIKFLQHGTGKNR